MPHTHRPSALFMLVRRSLQQHLLVSLVAMVAVALAGSLFLTVRALQREARLAAESGTAGFDAVLGARSSKLQLVLCALFHIEPAPGLLPASDLEYIRAHPAVERAIPVVLGDNYLGYRFVGTVPEIFEPLPEGRGPAWTLAPARRGEPPPRLFDPEKAEAVVGAITARRLGLRIGDRLSAYHGLTYNPDLRHDEEFEVTGILEPTGTPMDRVIFVPMRGLQTLAGHDPTLASDLAAILVALKSPAAGFQLDLLYNRRGSRVTFAWPAAALMVNLFDRFAWLEVLLGVIAGMVAVSGALTVMAVLHAGMAARKGDLAILRSLGARRRTLAGLLLLEGGAIAGVGALAALVLTAILSTAAAAWLRQEMGLLLEPLRPHPDLMVVPLALLGLGLLAAVVPALQAYRTDSAVDPN